MARPNKGWKRVVCIKGESTTVLLVLAVNLRCVSVQIALIVISMLLFGCNWSTNLFQVIFGMFLSSAGVGRRVLDVCNQMGLSISYLYVTLLFFLCIILMCYTEWFNAVFNRLHSVLVQMLLNLYIIVTIFFPLYMTTSTLPSTRQDNTLTIPPSS